MNPVESMEFLQEKLRDTRKNKDFLDAMNQ
jgi:transcription termination factor Rho